MIPLLSRLLLAAALIPLLPLHRGPSPGSTARTEPPAPYEVDTHQRMAWEAVRRSVNFKHFVEDLDLGSVVYSRNFPDAAHRAFPNIMVANTRAQGLVAAGAVLEDTPLTVVLRHFDDPIHMRGIRTPLANDRARDWAFDGGSNLNPWDWTSAMFYFEDAVFAVSEQDRMDSQEKLFVSIGHAIHLLEDEYQPGHTRLDSHAGIGLSGFQTVSPLEKWGIDHFNLTTTTPSLRRAVQNVTPLYFPTFMGFYADAGNFSNGKFFSEDTIFEDYDLPSDVTTITRTEPVPGQRGLVTFVVSTSLNDPLTGERMRMAKETSGFFGGTSYQFASSGDLVVEDQAQVLIPRAIAASAGLINHFFRGRFRISVNLKNEVEFTNTSDTSVTSADQLGFSAGTFQLEYEAVDGSMVPIPAPLGLISVSTELAVGGTLTGSGDIVAFIEGRRSSSLPKEERARPDGRIVALFRGTIGQERAVAAARGNADSKVLIAFDDDGNLCTLDPNTGVATLRLVTFCDLPATGFLTIGRVSASIYVSARNELWLGIGGRSECPACIMSLNTQTGEATVLFDNEPVLSAIPDLALRPSDGAIFAPGADGPGFFSIDTETAEATLLFASVPASSGNALTFDQNELLYLASVDNLFRVDPQTGASPRVAGISYTGFPTAQGTPSRVVAMGTRADGVVFCLAKDQSSKSTFLATIDLATGVVSNVGATGISSEGLAWVPASLLR